MQAEEISRLIGKNTGVVVYEVERGAIRRFADAAGDMNPLYRDDELARESGYETIITPPGFFGWPVKTNNGSALLVAFPPELVQALENAGYPLSSALDAGIEYEYFMPVKAGDRLSVVSTVKNLRERGGKMVFFTMENVYTNETGARVATSQAQYVLRNLASPETANA